MTDNAYISGALETWPVSPDEVDEVETNARTGAYVEVIHDSFGTRTFFLNELSGNINAPVTITRVLGAMNLGVSDSTEVFLNGNSAEASATLNPSDEIIITGKLVGGNQ